MKLIIDINDNEYMGIKEYPNNITSYPVTIHIYDAIRKGIPLEKEPCEDEEYEKDLNGLKEQILKEGNTLISKQDLLERFVEIDNEYKNSHWNLLQILTNIDILIGKEPCEDAVSRQAVLDLIADFDLSMGQVVKGIHALPPVNPQKIGHWIDMGSGQECSECREIQYGYDSFRYFCANCGAKMIELQESEDKWMRDYQKYINALRKCAEEHENDRTSMGHIIVSDLCRDIANLLEEVKQEPKWIPVSERLPEDRKEKLVYLSSNRITIAKYSSRIIPLAPYKSMGWGYESRYHFIDFETEEVIAWIPLPVEPYKLESESKDDTRTANRDSRKVE